jgi:uncharacterized protein YjeT (DUF2065 family)
MLHELLTALGLVFVIEGLLWALFPFLARRLLILAFITPEQKMRFNGVMAMALGVFIVWLARG